MYSMFKDKLQIVSLINVNKYLHSDTSETEVNINTSVNNGEWKNSKKKTTVTSGTLIIAVYASVIYIYTGWVKSRYTDYHYYTIYSIPTFGLLCISCTYLPSWLQYNYRFVGPGGWGVRDRVRKLWLKSVGDNGDGINGKSVVQVGSGGKSGMITNDSEKIFEHNLLKNL